MGEEKLKKVIQKSRDEIQTKSSKLKELKIEWVSPDKLKPNWYNPNRQSEHEFELLIKSMTEDGFTQPVIALRVDGTIVDGEHRWRAAQVVGYPEIPVVFVDMSPEQMRISTLRHNRARGSEDMELVAKVMRELRDLGAMDWAKDSLMVDGAELRHLFEEVEGSGVTVDVDKEFQKRTEDEKRACTDVLDPEHTHGTAVFVAKDERGREVLSSLTKDAADKVRSREQELKKQFKAEEHNMWEEIRDVVTFSFVYTDDEAKIVKAALGDAPAEKVLEICKGVEAAQVS